MSEPIQEGDVIQCDPQHCRWGPVFVIVTEVRAWGVLGYMMPAHAEAAADRGVAYIRVQNGHYVRIGRAAWKLEEEPGDAA